VKIDNDNKMVIKNYNTVILDNSLFYRVTIPEAAYIQLGRRPPEDEQSNTRNM